MNRKYLKLLPVVIFVAALALNVKATMENQLNFSSELAVAQEESYCCEKQSKDMPCPIGDLIVIGYSEDGFPILGFASWGTETWCIGGDDSCETLPCE